MHARSALFDLYGDHLADRDDWAPVAAVVRLLGAVGIEAPAVRTAVSRLCREGWLEAQERDGQRGYAATPSAQRRLAAAWQRIYRSGEPGWDGRWHVVVLRERVGERSRRARLTASLEYLGYARLAADTWVAPRESEELDGVLASAGVLITTRLQSTLDGDGAALAADLWDLDHLADSYSEFLTWADDLIAQLTDEPRRVFAVRTELVHRWRKFLFSDPGLPPSLLPHDWAGHRAADQFDRLSHELHPAAAVFVDACLAGDPDPTPITTGGTHV